jgi:hypothetical protein
LAFEAVTESPALVAGVDDVRSMRQAVDDGFREARVGEYLRPLAERQVRGDDQRSAFMSLGQDLEDELSGAVGQRQISELVADQQLDPSVAGDDAGELAAALRS